MTEDPADVRDALASMSNDYEVRRRLHTVPPHAVYEATVDGRRAVCKVGRGPRADPATEARMMEYVGRETAVPVPPVLAVGDNWFVAGWEDGIPGEGSTLNPERARVLGAGLATLHEETAGAFDATGFPRARRDGLAVDDRDSWDETVRDRLVDLRGSLAEFGYAEVAETALSALDDRPDLLTLEEDPVLAHGNYHPDHVAVTDGTPSCVVDWEHALVAPAGYDYLRTAMPLFASPGDTAAERRAFREGYESVRPLPGGFERRADAHRMVFTATQLESLFVQDRHGAHGEARFAAFAREFVREKAEQLRVE